MQTITLHETSDLAAGGRANLAAGVIFGAKLIGLESRNGRSYDANGLRAATALYEGIGVNCNHVRDPAAVRSVEDRFGEVRNVRFQDDGLRGDVYFLKAHPLAERVCEAVSRGMKNLFGLSHAAVGNAVQKAGRTVIESIQRVYSVDLVTDPATNRGLFEQVTPPAPPAAPAGPMVSISQVGAVVDEAAAAGITEAALIGAMAVMTAEQRAEFIASVRTARGLPPGQPAHAAATAPAPAPARELGLVEAVAVARGVGPTTPGRQLTADERRLGEARWLHANGHTAAACRTMSGAQPTQAAPGGAQGGQHADLMRARRIMMGAA